MSVEYGCKAVEMSTNPEVKGNGCWKLQREKGKEGRRKKNRSDDNGERILWA